MRKWGRRREGQGEAPSPSFPLSKGSQNIGERWGPASLRWRRGWPIEIRPSPRVLSCRVKIYQFPLTYGVAGNAVLPYLNWNVSIQLLTLIRNLPRRSFQVCFLGWHTTQQGPSAWSVRTAANQRLEVTVEREATCDRRHCRWVVETASK